MMRVAKTQLWVCPAAHFVSEHECADPRHVALESQHLQIQHQPGIIRKLFRHSNRFLHARQFFRGLLLRHLDLPLNTTHSIGILIEFGTITLSDRPHQPLQVLRYQIQDAAIFFHPGRPLGGVRAIAD